jgi:hypothetical protein
MFSKFIGLFLISLCTSTLADYNTAPINEQKQKIDGLITKRNQLISQIKNLSPNEKFLLATFNTHELIVQFTLTTLNGTLGLLNNIERVKNQEQKEKDIQSIKSSLLDICVSSRLEMIYVETEVKNKQIKQNLSDQISNTQIACELTSGVYRTEGQKAVFIY